MEVEIILKVGQKLTVADNVTIGLLEVAGRRVKFGIVAPREVKVVRGEVRERMAAERQGEAR